MYDPDYKPRLFDADGDLTKRWYIDFRVWDTDRKMFIRKQYYGMNKYTTLAERRRVAKKKLVEISQLVTAGYTAGQTPAANIGLDPLRACILEAVELVERNKTNAGRSGEDYARLRRRLSEPAHAGFAALPLRLVQPGHVLAFMEKLRERGIEAKSFNGYRDTLSAVFNYLLRLDAVPRNPVKGVERRAVTDSDQHQPYTTEQRAAVEAEIIRRGDTQLLLFLKFIYLGLTHSTQPRSGVMLVVKWFVEIRTYAKTRVGFANSRFMYASNNPCLS